MFPIGAKVVVIKQPNVKACQSMEKVWHGFSVGTRLEVLGIGGNCASCVDDRDFHQWVEFSFLSLPNFPAGRRVLNK